MARIALSRQHSASASPRLFVMASSRQSSQHISVSATLVISHVIAYIISSCNAYLIALACMLAHAMALARLLPSTGTRGMGAFGNIAHAPAWRSVTRRMAAGVVSYVARNGVCGIAAIHRASPNSRAGIARFSIWHLARSAWHLQHVAVNGIGISGGSSLLAAKA